jgi:hypothetical protein
MGQGMMAEYVFIDEWAIFDALADARTYPKWWKPAYPDVQKQSPMCGLPRGGHSWRALSESMACTRCGGADPLDASSGRPKRSCHWRAANDQPGVFARL